MKKLLIFILIIFTGCTNIKDINNLAIVNEIAIDYKDNYIVNIKILNNENEIITLKCRSLDQCFNNLSSKISKEIYLTHLDLLVLSNSIEEKQLKKIINFFLKEDTSRNSFEVIVVNKIDKILLNYSTTDIKNMINISINSNGIVKNKTFDDFIKEILNYKVSYIPYLNDLEIKGYKIVYKDNKILSKDESIITNFIFNYIKSITLLIDNKAYKLEDCETTYEVNNNLTIKIKCNTNSKNKKVIHNYLNNLLNNYLNTSSYYLDYLRDKYSISRKKIKTKIIINKIKTDKGDHFE